MRKIEQKLVTAILSGENFSLSNTTLTWHFETTSHRVGIVTLFGNAIAKIWDDQIELFDAGWQSSTTKSRLNAIIRCLELGRSIYQEKHQWYFAGYGYTSEWRGSLVIERWKVNKTPNQISEKLANEGYSDPILVDGMLWAFPPNGVMPIPVNL